MAASLATGIVAALLLVALPFIRPEDNDVTGAVLCGFALGWAMLAVLSPRLTDQPQRWAAAPALFKGLSGLLLLTVGPSVREVLDWLWPPALLALAVWMIIRIRRQLRSRSGRLLLYPVIATMAVASVGGGYATVAAAADASTLQMPGQLIDVGGHRLHLNCTGTGSPTVVIEPGAGNTSADLGWITPAVARATRVCVYDRAGRGWSEPANTTQDAEQIATDLHTLLHRAHVPGPYVLAGHSFGGLYNLTFAARYPDEVAGMVLIDSTAPAPAPAPAPEPNPAAADDAGSYDVLGRVSALISTSANVGLGRLIGIPNATALRSTIDEYLLGGTLAEQAASLQSFADKPLVVVTAGSGHPDDWFSAQNDLAALSTNSANRIIEGATHGSVVADERDAATTTRAILDVVSSVRNAAPLAR